MKYEKTLRLTPKRANFINKTLATEPKTSAECLTENETLSDDIAFDNGIIFAIDLCGVKFNENENNLPWTQTMLLDSSGHAVAYTEPDSEYLGKYELEYNDDTYIVTVIDHDPSTQLKCSFHFVTCTLAEAIDELNLKLANSMLPPVTITEDDFISSTKTDHADDWFDDYNFEFHKIFTGNPDELKKQLNEISCDIDYIEIN